MHLFGLVIVSIMTLQSAFAAKDCSDSHYLCGEFRRRYPIGSYQWQQRCHRYSWARQCKVCTMFCDDDDDDTTTTTTTRKPTTTTTKSTTTKRTTTTTETIPSVCVDEITLCLHLVPHGINSRYCDVYISWSKKCKATCPKFCESDPGTTTTTTTTRKPTTSTTTTTRKPTTTTTRKPTTSTTTTRKPTTSTTTTRKPTTTTRKPTTKTTTTNPITVVPGGACGDNKYWCAIITDQNRNKECVGDVRTHCIRSCQICSGPENEKCSNHRDESGYDCASINCMASTNNDKFRARRFCARTCCSRGQLY